MITCSFLNDFDVCRPAEAQFVQFQHIFARIKQNNDLISYLGDHCIITEDGINTLCNAINTCGGWLGHSLGLCMPLDVDENGNYVEGSNCEAIDCNHRAYILQNMYVIIFARLRLVTFVVVTSTQKQRRT